MKNKELYFSEIINLTLKRVMTENDNILCFGLGVTDPKGVFGTTLGLEKKFGKNRVFDVPASENALTGFAIGASINGFIPILTHQRIDFALLSLDQIINGAAKYHYMFGGKINVPICIRLIMGRGWGQGPTHSQNFNSLFAQIPGLKVVIPSLPNDAKNLLYSSILDPDPVIFLEHRWLHFAKGNFDNKFKKNEIGKSKVIKKGGDLTLCTMSYMTLEAIKAGKILKNLGIEIEIIDLRTIRPIDFKTIDKSIEKTSGLLCVDTGSEFFSVSSSIISNYALKKKKFKFKPEIIAMPNSSEPTSYFMTKNFYNDYKTIVKKVLKIFKSKKSFKDDYDNNIKHDIPTSTFKGPF